MGRRNRSRECPNYNSFLFNDIYGSDLHRSLRHLCASRYSRDGLFFCSRSGKCVPVLGWSSESTVRERLETVISSTVHVTINAQIAFMTFKRSLKPEMLMSPPAKTARHGRPRFNRALRHHVLPIANRGILQRVDEFSHRCRALQTATSSLHFFLRACVVRLTNKHGTIEWWTNDGVVSIDQKFRNGLVFVFDPTSELEVQAC